MEFDPQLGDIRFGCGLSPVVPPPVSVAAMLSSLQGPDRAARDFPVEHWDDFLSRTKYKQSLRQLRRQNRGTPEAAEARKAQKVLARHAREAQMHWLGQHLLRRTWTETPFRERLTAFWADHFTATGKVGLLRRAATPYVETAIRPHVAGRFEDLLIAAVLHPVMVHYLDQDSSVGTNSTRGLKVPQKAGVNENLAREVLELHTLGVGGPYTQTDVTELAEILTGVTLDQVAGFKFRKDWAEPGAETVLGRSYGGEDARLADVKAALRDLARHPATAAHLSAKLAVHFLGDAPEPGVAEAMAAAYRDSGGDLSSVYAALLQHPAAWTPARRNVKPAFDFVASACRALAIAPEAMAGLDAKATMRHVQWPLALMGHIWEKPDGPDGLPEADNAWITPQGVSARLQWALAVPQMLLRDLPDPRDFVVTALGPDAPPNVRFAAEAAESRSDGVGLVLASPAFQRV